MGVVIRLVKNEFLRRSCSLIVRKADKINPAGQVFPRQYNYTKVSIFALVQDFVFDEVGRSNITGQAGIHNDFLKSVKPRRPVPHKSVRNRTHCHLIFYLKKL